MNHLKYIIPALCLALASLSCHAGIASDHMAGGQEAAVPAFFEFIADLFYFDARSLFWMLIGGAIVALAVLPGSRSFRKAVPPSDVPQKLNEVKPVASVQASEQKPAGEKTVHSTEYWVGLDEATTVTVEELSRIEEEAEVFLMMGRPDVAIKVLRDHLDAEPSCKAYVWFKLLDIYHVQGMREAFERLAQEMKTRFNVALPTWDASSAEAESRQGLEHFPSLLAKIVQNWNAPSGLEYLQGLMQDNRQGERTGFHEEAFRDMLLLCDVLEARIKPDD